MNKPQLDPSSIFDTGETVAPGDVTYDRFCVPATIVQCFGRAFSFNFMKKLQQTKRDENEWPGRSCQLDHDQEYYAFLSYRGGTGRFRLWVTLCAYFNITAAFVALCVVFPALVYLVWCLFPEPIYYVSSVFFSMHTFENYYINKEVEEKFGEQIFRVLSEMRILCKNRVAILDFGRVSRFFSEICGEFRF